MVNCAGAGGGDSSPSLTAESLECERDGRGGGDTKRSTESGVRLAPVGEAKDDEPAVMVLARRRGVAWAGLRFVRLGEAGSRSAVGSLEAVPRE